MKKLGTLRYATVAVALSLLAACGTSAAEPSINADGSTDVTIGYRPLITTASVVNAQKAGLFKDQKIDAKITDSGGGAPGIASLMAGDFDFTYANYTSIFLAAQKGLPLQLVAGNDLGVGDQGIWVKKNSPIKTMAQLAGKRVAITGLQDIGAVAVSSLVDEAGADPKSVSFVELGFSDMQSQLQRGDVDAIWLVDPFQASAKAAGFRRLGDLFQGQLDNAPMAGWVTTKSFAQAHPDVVKGFQTALSASIKQLDADPSILQQLVPTYTAVTADGVKAAARPSLTADLDQPALQKESDLMYKYGLVKEDFDVSNILPNN